MKRIFPLLCLIIILLAGCAEKSKAQIVATTLPVYEFTAYICEGTGIIVDRLIAENVSCLHDYTLQVKQTKKIEAADLIVVSGAGLEDFLSDILSDEKDKIIATGIENEVCHEHDQDHEHHHETDPHLWLSGSHAIEMCENIYNGLVEHYPQHEDTFAKNKLLLIQKIDEFNDYAKKALNDITNRDIITFHDGFHYLASEYNLNIIKAIEEESGSEASAKELTEIILLIKKHNIKAIFVEANGSASAASIIARECNIPIYTLDMAMSGDSWFEAMRKNIDTLKEALQ